MDPNLSYIHRQESPLNLTRPAPDLLDSWAATTPDKEALVYVHETGREALTFRQFCDNTRHLAAWFATFGLKKGDRVAIFSKNCLEYGLCDLALQRLGICLTRLYVTLSAKQDLPSMIARSQCKLVIVQEKSMDSVLEFIPELLFKQNGKNLDCDQFPDLEQVITMGTVARDGFLPMNRNYEASDEELAKVAEIQASINMEDDCTIQPTSGSTGKSKLGVASFDGYTNLLFQTFQTAGLSSEDRLFTDRPMAHPLGAIMAMVQCGCTVVVANSAATIKNSNKEFLCNLIVQERVTVAIFLPYLMYDIANMAGDNQVFSHLKFAISSGQAAPPDIMMKLCQVTKVIICYGCSEIGDICCTEPGDDLTTITQTVGRPIPHLQVRVVDENRQVLPRNTKGLIEMKGTSFKRYHADPVKTAESIFDGWFRPGDVAQIDDLGRVRLHGRQTEVISVATRKYFPLEIENPLSNHPKVDKAVAFGIPDRRLYETIGLCVKPKQGKNVTEQEIMDFYTSLTKDDDSLSGVALKPSRVIVKESLPITASGKLDRVAIKRQCMKEINI